MAVSALLAAVFACIWIRNAMRLRQRRGTGSNVRVDPVTGLPSHQTFVELATGVFSSGRARSRAIMVMELDGLESIIDRRGLKGAKEILARTATSLSAAVKTAGMTNAIVARMNGAKFALLTTYRDSIDVLDLADRICADARRPGDQQMAAAAGVTMSIGVVFCLSSTPLAEALREADVALHRARNEGGNRSSSVAQGGRRDIAHFRRAAPRMPIRASQ
jgi:diguanylate cyclase (GGDEF)-like protein